MLGKPTLLYLNEEIHSWCFPEMPPVLNAKSPAEVLTSFQQATREEYRRKIEVDGPLWYERYHSEKVVAGRLFDSLIAANRSEKESDTKRNVLELRAQMMTTELGGLFKFRLWIRSTLFLLITKPMIRSASNVLKRHAPGTIKDSKVAATGISPL